MPSFLERRFEATQFACRTGSDVCFLVREEHDPVDSIFVAELTQLGRAFADCGEESCSACRLYLSDLAADGRFIRQLRGRDPDLDRRVVRHDRNNVVCTEPVDGLDGSFAGLVDFRALHRAGLVEDQRDVDRSTGLRRIQFEAGQADLQKRRLFFLSFQERVGHLDREPDLAGLD